MHSNRLKFFAMATSKEVRFDPQNLPAAPLGGLNLAGDPLIEAEKCPNKRSHLSDWVLSTIP